MTDASEKSGLPGAWGWPNLWWKSKCGCKGYGSLRLYKCNEGADPGYELTIMSPDELELDIGYLGAIKLEPMNTKEIEDVIMTFRRKSRLATLSEEILKTLREIGKLTNEK